MKRMMFALLFVAATAAAQTSAVIRCADREQTLTITGTGMAKAVPDRVSFSVGVSTSATTVPAAFRGNNEKTHAVVAALKKAGVRDAEIQTTNFEVSQDHDPQTRRPLSRYTVSNAVTVTREDPAAVSDLLQTAIDAGANEAGELNFFVADPSKSRDEALTRAFADARARAEKLAAAAGRTLGAATSITTNAQSYGYMQNTVREAITVAAGPDIEAGVMRITESVMVIFELK